MFISILLSLILLGGAALFGVGLQRNPEIWRSLPREKTIGIALGIIALGWTVHIVTPLLEGKLANLQPFLYPLAVAIAIGSYMELEYLFTRSMAGILLLMTPAAMHEAFVDHAPGRIVTSAICYLVGFIAIWFMASPYRFRDWLKAASERPQIRATSAAFLGIMGIGVLVISIGGLLR